MCRVFGCVAAEPVSIRHELLDAGNPMIRQSEEHDSGWGMAVYERGDGAEPKLIRCPEAAYMGGDYVKATSMRGRIFNVHVRRATMGGLTLENTHPFCLGNYSFGHNGTVLHWPRLLEEGVAEPAGETDSEALFNLLMRDYDPAAPLASLRAAVAAVVQRSPFSGVNFLFSDGERLYAYRFGLFDLHWLARPGQLLVSSEKLTDERWHTVQQDVILVLDPEDLDEPHAARLLGDELAAQGTLDPLEPPPGLRGAKRGEFAAGRAASIMAGREDGGAPRLSPGSHPSKSRTSRSRGPRRG
jgi:predicted glutamine amidotransferase